jgi:FkbM family methyltransferase
MRRIVDPEQLIAPYAEFKRSDRFGPASEHIIRGFYLALLQPGDTAIDVGVHYGIHLFDMARATAPGGHVFGVEANPERFQAMERRRIDSAVENATIFNVAAGNRNARVAFNVNVTNTGRSGLLVNKMEETDIMERIDVDMRPLDDLVPDAERLRFIKIDVEGAEAIVIQGARRIIGRARPCVIFEGRLTDSADTCGIAYGELMDTLSGYAVFDLFGDEVDFRTASGSGWNFRAIPDEQTALNAAATALAKAWNGQLATS